MAKSTDQHRVSRLSSSNAFTFVLTLGVLNLFADTTYEGGGSINGPFLANLGATAAAVSIIAGLGEFLGYSLRSVAGYIADRTGKYWPITFLGYTINLLAVPAMALAGNWQTAAALILAERIGRAIRKPTIGAMLSYTTGTLGKGWVYGLNTALDETGATIGPLLMAFVLYMKGSYRTGYGLLLVSSLLALVTLSIARIFFPAPSQLEAGPTARAKGFNRTYWLYVLAAACFGAGLMSFELISYHLAASRTVAEFWIPIFVAVATGIGVAANLILGRLYDRFGLPVVMISIAVASLFSPLVFLGGFYLALAGMILWGIGYAVEDTLLAAIVAGMLPEGRRNLAFGLFYTGYGVGWLIGSIAAGLLYERSIPFLIAFSIAVQLASLPIFFLANKSSR